MNYTISLPEEVKSGSHARQLLERALDYRLEPIRARAGPLKQIALYLPPVIEARIQALHDNDFDQPELMRRLICAALKEGSPAAKYEPAGWNRNRVQDEMVAILKRAIASQQIALLEGSTGIGKSRVIARTVVEHGSKKRIGVFGPTLQVVYHLAKALLDVSETATKRKRPRTVLSIGKRNFVDSAKVEVILETLDVANPEMSKKIRAWCEADGPPTTLTTKKLHELTREPVTWLVEDLVKIVPELSAASLACDETTKPCPGLDSYLRCKADLDEADVIFSTHAMLCISTMRMHGGQPELFPAFDAIFVDEAQDLESAMANVAGNDVSLRHLRSALRKGAEAEDISGRLWDKLDAALEKCRQSLDRMDGDCFIFPGHENEYPKFAKVCEDAGVLASLLAKIRNKDGVTDAAWFGQIRQWLQALEQIISGKYTVSISYSKALRLPSLSVGPSYLRHYFKTLWDNVRSAGLLSATLYAPKGNEDFSAWWIRRNLCVPKDRYLEASPFVAPWIYSTPTVFLPSESNASTLARPETESDERFDEWHGQVALTVRRIAAAAAGGTLVLCNSYDEIRALAPRLSSLRQTRVIAQEPDDSITQIKNAFLEMTRDGIRPIWLATGGAWTGLDLTDEAVTDPTKDNLLTDLVIVRIPLGRSRSVAHRIRVERLGLEEEFVAAAFLLRQGIGRLIRREGVQNRRLWFLDGRILLKGPRGATFSNMAKVLQFYPKKSFIE